MSLNQGTLKRNLGLWAIVGLGLGYMTPTVVFDTFAIVSEDTHGAVPSAYIVALVVMAFTAVSYGKMVGVFPQAGSAYTYTRESMHPNVGFLVGWVALLDYLMLPLVNVLILRLYLESVWPEIPGWVTVVLLTIVITGTVALTMRGTSNFNSLLLLFALVVMVVFCVFAVNLLLEGHGNGTVLSTTPFVGEPIENGLEAFEPLVLVGGATVVCFSFIGFDAITMYAEEAKNPKIMPRAILLTVMLGGLIFLIAGYLTQQLFPTNEYIVDELMNNHGESLEKAESDLEDPLPAIGKIVGGPVFQFIFVSAGFAATMASGLASHASVSRMLLVMGRNNLLPGKIFGRINPKTSTPVYSVIIVGVVALLAIWLDLDTVASIINFGALIAFTFVNLSVIAWFAIRQGRRHTPGDIFKYIVMPAIGTLLTTLLWSQLDQVSLITGSIWLVVGVLILALVTRGFRKQPANFDEAQPVTGFTKLPDA